MDLLPVLRWWKLNECLYCFRANYFKNQNHNNFILLNNTIPNKIGGGHHKTCIKKLQMEIVCPYIKFAPANHLDFKTCEFLDHLKTSNALTKYDNSMCNIPLHLSNSCLFPKTRTSIGQLHNIHILKE